MAVRGSREAVYASMLALHASPVDWMEVSVFTYWTSYGYSNEMGYQASDFRLLWTITLNPPPLP